MLAIEKDFDRCTYSFADSIFKPTKLQPNVGLQVEETSRINYEFANNAATPGKVFNSFLANDRFQFFALLLISSFINPVRKRGKNECGNGKVLFSSASAAVFSCIGRPTHKGTGAKL